MAYFQRMFLPPVFLNLVLGLLGGVFRMGVLPWVPQTIVSSHGAIMVIGFVFSIIAVERAVTLHDPFLKAAAISS
ncbi:MAG: hypothetical protein N3H84_00275 [Candidatus Caldarchaeum sp.]|nr:hypothetical protein [Candidatus Caldarchaeum sp.]